MIRIEADVGEDWDRRTDWGAVAARAVHGAIAHSSHAALSENALDIEVSIKFASDDEVRALNRAWRGKDQPTNVLSFPMVEARMPDSIAAGEPGELLLGDIILAHGVCAAEAQDRAMGMADHAAHLIVHGTLHLLGYDHETGDADAARMETLERTALASLGIADPYAVSEV